MSRFLTAHQQN